VPLKELLVFHPDEGYLADIQSLQRYIQSELNVRDVVFSSDEALCGVHYSAVADWGVLGRKLRKDLARVKTALPKVPSDDIKAYTTTGKITVDGIDLVEGDLTVQRYLEIPPSSKGQFATNTDNDVVIRLDIQLYADLQEERLARELTNRVQKLRKKAGLQATDDVDVFYHFEEGLGADLLSAIQANTEVITRIVGSLPTNVKEKRADAEIILEEEQEIDDTKFMLYLAKP
jgi:isoleucyl-tRNA synthetase